MIAFLNIGRENKNSYSNLINIIEIQNRTINTLESLIDSTNKVNFESIQDSRAAVTNNIRFISSAHESECESRYGLTLIEKWKEKDEVWCTGTLSVNGVSEKVELRCYPYYQAHKVRDGRGADLFCEASNVFIDFSKVRLTR